MKSYAGRYSSLFTLTWASMFIIHPSWTLPIPLIGRGFLYFGLLAYFILFAYITNRSVNAFTVNAPPIVWCDDLLKHSKDSSWLLSICFVAVLLQITPILSPIYLIGDEALFLQNGLWVYDYFGAFSHTAVQYSFWIVVALMLIRVGMRSSGSLEEQSSFQTKKLRTCLLVAAGLCLLIIYFILIHDIPFQGRMIRYPPLQNLLYLLSYVTFGINHVGARLWQLVFYILSAVYLYRTINLFSDKETALLGASIFLFSPIIFSHAHFAEIASGLIFFIIIISYYFLRFLIYHDNRGLLLASFFIGTGFLYKRDIFLMYFICAAYLAFQKYKNREFQLVMPLKILSLPLLAIIPWMVIGKLFNWRNAWVSIIPFASLDKVSAYLLSIPAQLSWFLFILFLISIIYVLYVKRDHLIFYWGFLFVSFYCFYTSQHVPEISHRFSMAFYPTIAVFLAIFLTGIVRKLKWKHSFKLVYVVLTIYLISLCMAPFFNAQLVAYKNIKEQYFPNKEAMTWVKDNIKKEEKLLSLRFKPDLFYGDKYGINKDDIISFWYSLQEVSTPQKLRTFCNANEISYILIPDGPHFIQGPGTYNKEILHYMRDNKREFVEAAKFNLEDNYIYIFKVKEI